MNVSARMPSRLVLTIAFTITALLLGIIGAVAAGTGTVTPPPKIAFVTTNADIAPDALTVGPMAGRLGAPLFITDKHTLGEDTKNALVAYGPQLIIIAGGPNTVTDPVLAQIAAATGLTIEQFDDKPDSGIIRAFGAGRDQTAARLSELIANYNPKFLPVDATATDADLLDGKDSAAFQSRVTGSCIGNSAMATVASDGTVRCQPTYPTRGSVSVSSLGAVPRFSSTSTAQSGGENYVGRYATAGDDFLVANVPLPDGATITSVTAVFRDNHASLDACFHLYTSTAELVASAGCSAGASTAVRSITKEASVKVNGSLGYFTYMEVSGFAGSNLIPIRMIFDYTLG